MRWFGNEPTPIEAREEDENVNAPEILISEAEWRELQEHSRKLQRLEEAMEEYGGWPAFLEYRAYVRNGKCRYALLDRTGRVGSWHWPIDINRIFDGTLHPEALPPEWQDHGREVLEAQVMIVPLFLAQAVERNKGAGLSEPGVSPATVKPREHIRRD